MKECRELTIYGGGGGGGGTSECCQPFHIGYGFSFSLHYVNDSHLTKSEMFYNFDSKQAPSSEQISVSAFDPNSSTTLNLTHFSFQDGEEIRYQFDLMGRLLHDSSMTCGGFNSWCCVCNQTQFSIRNCLSNNPSRESSQECLDINNNLQKVSWIINATCCFDFTPTNYSIGISSNSSVTSLPKTSDAEYNLSNRFGKDYFRLFVNLQENGIEQKKNQSKNFDIFHNYNRPFQLLIEKFQESNFWDPLAGNQRRIVYRHESSLTCEDLYHQQENVLLSALPFIFPSAIQLTDYLIFLLLIGILCLIYFYSLIKKRRNLTSEAQPILQSSSKLSYYGTYNSIN